MWSCASLAAALVVSPWLARNYVVFGKFVFIRDNLPLEMHIANNEQSTGLWTRSEHPGNDPEAMRRFQELGEIRFMEEKQQRGPVSLFGNIPESSSGFTLDARSVLLDWHLLRPTSSPDMT